jgi:hypothetical protein
VFPIIKRVTQDKLPTRPDMAVVGYCHVGMVTEAFCRSLANMTLIDKLILGMAVSAGPMIPVNRNIIAHQFLETECIKKADWLLSLDTDHEFDWNLCRVMIGVAQEVDADIVHIPYIVTKNLTTVMNIDGDPLMVDNIEPDCIYEAPYGGTGCMLISRRILEKIKDIYKDEKPYEFFAYGIFDTAKYGRRMIGEDFFFCGRAMDVGAKIVCYTGIKVGHVKQRILNVE